LKGLSSPRRCQSPLARREPVGHAQSLYLRLHLPDGIVVEEIFAVHEYIKDVCRRFAKIGYATVAPEPYGRLGDLSKMTDETQIFIQVIRKARMLW
jgi:dienelactone hydrolase